MVPLLRLALCAALAACTDERLVATAGDVDLPARLELRPAFVGHTSTTALPVRSLAKVPQRISVDAHEGVISNAATQLSLAGGAVESTAIRFSPVEVGRFELDLPVTIDERVRTVHLTADALAEPPCAPTSCQAAKLDDETMSCVQVPLADATPCTSACVEAGSCANGVCVGTARSCDDSDPCTHDVCDPTEGCQHPDATSSCPAPTDPCMVAACDRELGCTSERAPDGTACGALDCSGMKVCVQGRCLALPTPEGTPCDLGESRAGTCVAGVCEEPPCASGAIAWEYRRAPEYRGDPYAQLLADEEGNTYWVERRGATGPFEIVSRDLNGLQRFRVQVPASVAPSSQTESLLVALIGDWLLAVARDEPTQVAAWSRRFGTAAWLRDLKWDTTLPSGEVLRLRSPSIADDGAGHATLLFQSTDSQSRTGAFLLSLHAATSTRIWSARPDCETPVGLVADEGGAVYFSCWESGTSTPGASMRSYAADGSLRWRVQRPSISSMQDACSVVAGRFYDVNGDVLSTQDGALLYKLNKPTNAPVLGDGARVFNVTGTSSGIALQRFDPATGSALWNTPVATFVPEYLLTSSGSVLVLDNSNKSMREVTAEGVERCRWPTSESGTRVVLHRGRAIIAFAGGLRAYDVGLDTAARGWVQTFGNPRRSSRPR